MCAAVTSSSTRWRPGRAWPSRSATTTCWPGCDERARRRRPALPAWRGLRLPRPPPQAPAPHLLADAVVEVEPAGPGVHAVVVFGAFPGRRAARGDFAAGGGHDRAAVS